MRFSHYIKPLNHTFVQHVGGQNIVVPTAARPASVYVPGGGGPSLAVVSQLIDSRINLDNTIHDDQSFEPLDVVFSDLPPLP